jgi:hypothetical protein
MYFIVTGAAGFCAGVTLALRALAFTETGRGEMTCIS